MKRALVLILGLIFTLPAGIAQAAFSNSDYQYSKTVQAAVEGFAFIALDQEVLNNTRDDLADLRISDGSGQEVPYQITPLALSAPEARPLNVINESRTANEYTFVLDMGESGLLHNQLSLDISSDKEYMADLYLEGSQDQRQWALVKNYKIFNVAPHYSNKSFEYPLSSWRFLRIRIACNPLPRLTLSSVKALYANQIDPHLTITTPIIISSGPSSAPGRSEIVLDLGSKGYYIQNLYISSTDRNYERAVKIFSSNTPDNWQVLGSGGRINHFVWSGYEAREDRIMINQSSCRYIKIEIENGSSPALNISQITVKGAYPRLLADLKPGAYRLWYCSSQASKPQYDLARFSRLIDTSAVPLLTPGLQEINPAYSDPRPWSEKNRWLLNGALILAVIILGGLLIKNLRGV